MQDQPSTSNYEPEPPRLRSIPDDFIWDPETQAWYAPGEPSNWDQAASSRELQETIRRVREKCIAEGTWDNGTVIRVGPLGDVPQRMRKSLRNKPGKRLPLFDDDDIVPTNEELTSSDPDGDEPSDELP
ncbi:MAG TPA: hypothetical protein VNH11_10095 [Pirellulales bacterium]|nr:hypothetical protein [Pirellulales bacterium]